MTTPADALEVMAIVSACHHRTAPRMDDRATAIATAGVWADLFNIHSLELPDLIAAVKKRAAAGHVDAPEPAEIITFAREIRRDRADRIGPTPEYQALCESKGEPTEAERAYNRERLAVMVDGVAARKGIDA